MGDLLKRSIRKSGYGDYFAIDMVDEKTIVSTPLYLNKNEQKEIRMRWDDGTITEFEWDDAHCWMENAFIKFDGEKVWVAYAVPSLGQKDITWFEPTLRDLTHLSVIHFTHHKHDQ